MSTKAKLAIDTFGKDHVINATLGALYDDRQQLVTFPSVYQTLKQLPDVSIASYASSLTAPLPFARAVKQWGLHPIDDDALVIATPGAFTHYAYALHDAVEMKTMPVVEVHFSNIEKREPWRAQSVISPEVDARFFGEGMMSYEKAFTWLMNLPT
jgi:hypothetical protein